MGADSLIQLPTWHAWEELIQYVNFAVASRPQHDMKAELSPAVMDLLKAHQTSDASALENQASGLIYIDASLAIDLSSTALRSQLKRSSTGSLGSEQIPASTLQIITNLGLYQ
jgi:nicotinate-nucleotide adenylyltransferase